MATLLGNQALSESAFQSLLSIGSAAGYYIRAREIGGSTIESQGVRGSRNGKQESAWEYLEDHRGQIEHDPRCLNLLFDYWWASKTGHRLFHDERAVLPFGEGRLAVRLATDQRPKINARSSTWTHTFFLGGAGTFPPWKYHTSDTVVPRNRD